MLLLNEIPRKMTADISSSTARCAVYRFILTRRSRATPRRRASEINSRTCAWHDPGRLLARRSQSMQVNAMRLDAQRLQSATC